MNSLESIGEFVEINDHKMHVYRTGNPDKTKLVLMSGSSTVAPVYDFKILYTNLQEHFRIIIIEKFGYGSTPSTAFVLIFQTFYFLDFLDIYVKVLIVMCVFLSFNGYFF